ncbi:MULTISPECIES: hypothetical protein [Thermomonosporaceae]|uniref:hypothetical protein n=1 Tax=Thermomonosporaceae TaxID=2012 RepID=UPI00255AB4C1|nr:MULTISPECIES: hypothetical protein [Thermomonosporaceae]MDL4772850.1 hypothetical protein [Actinomadura xylanilytica]
MIGVLIGGGLLVLVVIAVAAFVILGDDDGDGKRRRTIAVPTYSAAPSEPGSPSAAPGDSGTGTGIGGVLTSTITTAAGKTFTRVGTRTASCTSRADADLAKALSGRSCVEDMQSAVYATSDRTIITVISILKFSDASTASEVSDATSEGANPELLTPSTNSGIPHLDRKPTSWVRSWTQGQHVVYAQSYYARGTEPGSRTGVVYTTAGELGLKVTSSLMSVN